ncbi:hypothetical protein B5C34_09565 [Pacificimonas flava]|uniref:Helix-turn-helix domain-containing protein n=2 Tax=Pacificimonas TaxID=1960290 RepID=A0A219B665_9SPHN|nr:MULTISPECIES: replication protein A [Pacificimonas]MBZ6379081.1 hypothetical protein [Pacificimonas aurantium]OWV33684.1 hypothetical protein B5C34_09565 [Pacificimonas flava]
MTARSIGSLLTGTAMPKARRTFQPVRRNSYDVDDPRLSRWWQPAAPNRGAWRRTMRIRLDAAERFDRKRKAVGKRNGPLGHVALEVLRLLYGMIDYRSGRLDPSIDTICARTRRARAAVVRAMRRLKEHGFLEWRRRTEPTGNEGAGPQVRQATNAYRLPRPAAMSRYLDKREEDAPAPDDELVRRETGADELAAMEAGLDAAEFTAVVGPDGSMGEALADMARHFTSASSPGGQNPAPGEK